MEEVDHLPDIISFIKKFDYPLVHSMTPHELADVFSLSNRCFLISWAFLLLDEQHYGNIIKGREQDRLLLAELMYCHGFCSDYESVNLLTGNLPLKQQVRILHSTFHFIERQKKAAKLDDVEKISLEEIVVLKNKDLNLFSSFGETRTLTDEERDKKMSELAKATETLRSKLETVHDLKDDLSEFSEVTKGQVKQAVGELEESLGQFVRVEKSVARQMASKVEPTYKIDPTTTELLRSCGESSKTITQYIEDLKTINDFVTGPILERSQAICQMVEALGQEARSLQI